MNQTTTENSYDNGVNRIILACSGASDVGELTDRLARKFRNNKLYNMKCLAMVAADKKELIESIKKSETLVIDGCPVDCGKLIMEEAWLTNYQYVRLTDLGYIKGKTPVTDELVDKVYNQILERDVTKTILQQPLFKEECCEDGNE
jgi:uncharacterized metal-binding protein